MFFNIKFDLNANIVLNNILVFNVSSLSNLLDSSWQLSRKNMAEDCRFGSFGFELDHGMPLLILSDLERAKSVADRLLVLSAFLVRKSCCTHSKGQ